MKTLMERVGSPFLGNICCAYAFLSDKHVEGEVVLRSCPGKAWIDIYHLLCPQNQPGKAQRWGVQGHNKSQDYKNKLGRTFQRLSRPHPCLEVGSALQHPSNSPGSRHRSRHTNNLVLHIYTASHRVSQDLALFKKIPDPSLTTSPTGNTRSPLAKGPGSLQERLSVPGHTS